MDSCGASIVIKLLFSHLPTGSHAAQNHHGLGEQSQKQESRGSGRFVFVQSLSQREDSEMCRRTAGLSSSQGLMIQRGSRCDLFNGAMLYVNGYAFVSILSGLGQETDWNCQAAAVEMQFGLSGQTSCQEPN